MTSGRNSGSDHDAMLRRVAIVLSSLPAPVASKLLGAIGPESKHALRRVMTTLADVDPLERRRALQAFKNSVQQQPRVLQATARVSSGGADEFVSHHSTTQPVTAPRGGTPGVLKNPAVAPSEDPSNLPLSFLSDVDDDTLVRLMVDEHPQAVALVLASIAPVQSARVLPRLDPSLRAEALSRLGRLGDVPEAAAAEVAEHFRSRIRRHTIANKNSTGRRALDAILAAMPPTATPATATPASAMAASALAAGAMASAAVPSHSPAMDVPPPTADVPTVHATAERNAASAIPQSTPSSSSTTARPASSGVDAAAVDAAHHLHVADHSWPEVGAETAPRQTEKPEPVDPLRSTDAIQRHLLSLLPVELCQALGRVSTRQAMLALCGLPNQVAESVLAVLPRSQAKQVRVQMNSLGSLHLREIDEAKENVARASLAIQPAPQVSAAA